MGKKQKIYIAASSYDARFTRVCVASVRYFYPKATVRLLPGGELDGKLVSEMRRFWDVEVMDLPKGDYGWGFVKLEPLFDTTEKSPFLVLDSDTVLTGDVFALFDEADGAPFLVDLEGQSQDDVERLYYTPVEVGEKSVDLGTPRFVFNSGQWFGTPGVLAREDFTPWLEWDFPRKLRFPDAFKNGEQGLLNYVLNQKVKRGEVVVCRRKLMRWPLHGMQNITAKTVADGSAPALVVHWAGPKALRWKNMPGSDVLSYFERLYYSRVPLGRVSRQWRTWTGFLRSSRRALLLRIRLFWKYKMSSKSPKNAVDPT